ncbi:Mechanosensitive ion channel protein 10-like protein [Drosera capensis]
MGSIVHDSPTKPLATESVCIQITESANESEIAKSKNCPSPDITVITSSSTNKPPKIPRYPTLTRRTTFKSKPKSRFGEPEFPIESAVPFGFTSGSPGGLSSRDGSFGGACSRQVSFASGKKSKDGIRPDEKEVYERVTAQLSARDKKRMTVKLLIELAVFLCLLGCLVSSLTVKGWKRYVLFGLEIWKWFLLLLVIFSGMLVTHWIVHVIVFLIEWKFLLKKHVVYFTHGLKTSVEVFIWLSVVLATWGLFIKPDNISQSRKTRNILDFVTWSIVSLVIGAFLWLVKTALLKLLASSCHLNRFFDRIQESVFHHYVLQTLSGRPVVELAHMVTRKESQVGQVSFVENVKGHKENKAVDIAKLHQMKQDKVPSWTLQLLVDVVSNSGLSTMSGMLDEDMVEGGVELDDDEITSEEQAIATAVRIFENVIQDKDDQSYIDRDDLHRFLIWEEVDLLFPLFEVNETEKTTLKAFAKWVVSESFLLTSCFELASIFTVLVRFV